MTDMLQLAREAAAELGEGWSGRSGHHDRDAHIGHTDGRCLFLLRSRGRAEITGCYPEGYFYRHNGPRITVSTSRAARGIASDIRHRFLPAYELALAEVTACHERLTREDADRAATADRILSLPGTRLYQVHGVRSTTIKLPESGNEAVVNHDGSAVRVKLDLPADAAVALLAQISSGDSAAAAARTARLTAPTPAPRRVVRPASRALTRRSTPAEEAQCPAQSSR